MNHEWRMRVRAHRITVGNDDLAVIVLPAESSSSHLRELTPAEREVAARLLQGESNAAIARSRGTKVRTVANQAASIFRKLGISSRSEFTALVMGTSMNRARGKNG